MAAYKDYYDILGVPKTATEKEIRSAFRKLAAKHHPDRNLDDAGAEERFKEINEAYTALSDPEKRKIYDQFGTTSGQAPYGGHQGGRVYSHVDPEQASQYSDFFQTLFGGGMGGFVGGSADMAGAGFTSGGFSRGDPFAGSRQTPRRQAKPRSVEAEFPVDVQHAYRGGDSTFMVGGKRVTVSVPPGVRDGQKLRLRGQAPGGGDLLLVIRHEEHPVFTVDGDTVRVTVDVPDHTAALGGTVRVETLDGPVEMTLPASSSSGRVLRLRGQGWPKKGGGRGDELAEVRVSVPSQLTEAQRDHYESLRELSQPAEKTPEEKTAATS